MTKEEIRHEINRLEVTETGKRMFPDDLKRHIVDSIPTFARLKDADAYYKISATQLSKWKQQSRGVITARSVQHGSAGIRYSLSTKIQVCEYVLKEGRTVRDVANTMKVSHTSIGKWIRDYQDGLFNLEHCTQVSRKRFRSYELIIGKIKDAEAAIDDLKREAKESLDREYENKLKEIA